MRISDWSSGVCSSDLQRRMNSTVPLPPRSALALWLPRVLLPWLLLLAAPGCTPTAKALDSSELAFEGQNYRIVHVNLKRQQLSLHWREPQSGQPFSSIETLRQWGEQRGQKLL